MKDKKIYEVFLKVIKRMYDQNPEMQEEEVCAEKVFLLNRYIFNFAFLCCCLYHNEQDLSKQKG